MSQPLVSVIIPIYNAAPYLARCLESVRRQRYQNLEIILANDGSSDVSLPICEMYARADGRILVIDKENGGVSETRNFAIDVAKGEYIQFVDSDDWLDENATRLLVERAEETQSDLVIAHYCRVDKDKIGVYGFLNETGVLSQEAFARQLMEEPASFYYGVMWNKLYRSELIHRHRIRCSEELVWSEDFLFNLEYIRYAQRFCALQTPIYYYYKNDTSITATKMGLLNTMEVKRSLFMYYKDLYTRLGLYDNYKLQIYKYLIATAEHS
ncbi:MAG: glycosyltransferase [Oscillospiraceae bacterium]